jgi:hypothetical protein
LNKMYIRFNKKIEKYGKKAWQVWYFMRIFWYKKWKINNDFK